MDTTSFLAAVDRAITVPNYQPRFSQTDILALANEEQSSMIVPMIVALREEFFVFREEIAVNAGDTGFRIPERAIGRTLREIQYNNTGGGMVYDLPRISIEDSYRFSTLTAETSGKLLQRLKTSTRSLSVFRQKLLTQALFAVPWCRNQWHL